MTAERTILVSGDGAAPAVAVATALHAAAHGHRTFLLAADDPHRAVDALLGARLGTEPAEYAPGLTAARIDEQDAFRDAFGEIGGRLRPAFDLLGADPLEPEELTALPGASRLALLRLLPRIDADVLVVAAPPPAGLIATLALPEQLRRYLDRLVPEQRQAARALRPLLAGLAGVPMPADWLYEARAKASVLLDRACAALTAPGTSVRLVVGVDGDPLPELRRARAALGLFGHREDSLIVHGTLPDGAAGSADPWLAALADDRRRALEAITADSDVPVYGYDLTARTPREIARALYGEHPAPGARPRAATSWPVADRLAEEGLLLWRFHLPGGDRADLDLVRRGDELVIGLGAHRRILPLPSALRRCVVTGAGLEDDVLTVRFTPDPALWPRG
ncbi:ArsA family ATPase [Kitasatospora sp. NPDC004240]